MKAERLMIIGFDGAMGEHLTKFVDEGVMPNVAALWPAEALVDPGYAVALVKTLGAVGQYEVAGDVFRAPAEGEIDLPWVEQWARKLYDKSR